MTITVMAHFDGRVFVPEEHLNLPAGEPVVLRIDTADILPGRFADLCDLAADLPDAPADGAAQHDHYLYGTPKK